MGLFERCWRLDSWLSEEHSLCNNYAIIDFDMIGQNWFGYDIASFFYTHCREDTPKGDVQLKLGNIPGRKTRRLFIERYLAECLKIGRNEMKVDINRLMQAVDLLMCFGWLFSSVTRYSAYLLNNHQESYVAEIRKRIKFFRIAKAKWNLDRELVPLLVKGLGR